MNTCDRLMLHNLNSVQCNRIATMAKAFHLLFSSILWFTNYHLDFFQISLKPPRKQKFIPYVCYYIIYNMQINMLSLLQIQYQPVMRAKSSNLCLNVSPLCYFNNSYQTNFGKDNGCAVHLNYRHNSDSCEISPTKWY